MWRAVTDAVGAAGRDALWDYPDLVPTAEDIDDPAALVARLQALARGDAPARDEFDEALDALLTQAAEESAGTSEGGRTEATDGPDDDAPASDEPRPV